jgi:hypothetical protein
MHSTCVEGDQADLHEIIGVLDCMVSGFAHRGKQIRGGEILLLASLTGWARDIL